MKIALTLDNPYRDLPGIVLVAQELAQRGHQVYLTPFNLLTPEIQALVPDMVVMPHLKHNVTPKAHNYLRLGIHVAVLDTEGGPYKSLDYYRQLLTRDAELRDQISLVCAWGHLRRDYCVAQGLFREDQLRITGSPRHDLFHQSWRKQALESSRDYVTTKDPFFLVATNFTYANPRFQSRENELKMAVEEFQISEQEARGYIEDQQCILEGFLEMTDHITETVPGATTVFRPHPFENLETYEKGLRPRDNLQVKLEGSIEGWVMRARALIQRDSTTAIDAAIAGVPVLTPDWLPTSFGVPEIGQVSDGCANLEEMREKLAAILQNRYEPDTALSQAIDNVIEGYYYKLDGQSHMRAAAAIDEAASRITSRPDIAAARRDTYGWTGWQNRRESLPCKLRTWLQMQLAHPPGYSLRTRRDVYQERVNNWESSGKKFLLPDVDKISEMLRGAQEHAFTWRRAGSQEGDYWQKGFLGRSLCVTANSSSTAVDA